MENVIRSEEIRRIKNALFGENSVFASWYSSTAARINSNNTFSSSSSSKQEKDRYGTVSDDPDAYLLMKQRVRLAHYEEVIREKDEELMRLRQKVEYQFQLMAEAERHIRELTLQKNTAICECKRISDPYFAIVPYSMMPLIKGSVAPGYSHLAKEIVLHPPHSARSLVALGTPRCAHYFVGLSSARTISASYGCLAQRYFARATLSPSAISSDGYISA